MSKKFTYSKSERLKSRKLIQQLFTEGKSFNIFPLKVYYLQNETLKTFLQAGVSVSSKSFKKAVDRNRIKRLLREAYRTEKNSLEDYLKSNHKKLILFFVYLDKALPEFALIKAKMILALKRLEQELNETVSENN